MIPKSILRWINLHEPVARLKADHSRREPRLRRHAADPERLLTLGRPDVEQGGLRGVAWWQ